MASIQQTKVILLNNSGGNPAAAYDNAVIATSPISYWKLNEGGGSAILDSSGNGYDGTYTGVTWDGTTLLGEPVPFWDGANDVGDMVSSGITADFDINEGCLLMWLKANASSVWSDTRLPLRFLNNASHRIDILTVSGLMARRAIGLNENLSYSTTSTEWLSVIFSWSDSGNARSLYINGNLEDSAGTAGTGTNGTLTTAAIGAAAVPPSNVWHGYIARVAMWDIPVNAGIIALGTV